LRWNERADPPGDAISSQWIDALEVQRRPAMKKNSIVKQSLKGTTRSTQGPITVGLDLGDKTSCFCMLGSGGEILAEGSVSTWLSRLLTSLGFEVIVANARQGQLISASSRKNDKMDAQLLARLARLDPELLRPIRHRSEQ